MTWDRVPSLNAGLNGACAVLLLAGLAAIKSKRVTLHRILMGAAFAVSTLFLASYLAYHARAGVIRYRGTGPLRAVYLAVLSTHTVLAALVVPMVLRTLYLALRGRFEEHRRAARWTFPTWLYVSVTGVVIYLMLYGPGR